MDLSARMRRVDPAPLDDMFSFGVDPSILSLACGNPDPALFPAAGIARAAAQAIETAPVDALQYGRTNGYPPLLDLIRERLWRRQGIRCAENELLITSGSQQGFELLAKCFVNEGDPVIVEEPAFIGTLNAFRSAGARLVGVPLLADGIDLAALERALKAHPDARFIYTISTSNNPTGITLSPDKRRAFYALAERYGVPVAEDDPYSELRFDGRILPPLKSMDTKGLVLYFGSFSKILAPGLRVGYVCADASIVRALSTAKQTADLQTSAISQVTVARYAAQNDLDRHIEALRACYARKCEATLEAIRRYFPAGVSHTEPDGGLFLWCDLNDGRDTNRMAAEALRRGVAYVPGYAFMVDQSLPRSTLRLNYSAFPAEALAESIRRLGRLFGTT